MIALALAAVSALAAPSVILDNTVVYVVLATDGEPNCVRFAELRGSLADVSVAAANQPAGSGYGIHVGDAHAIGGGVYERHVQACAEDFAADGSHSALFVYYGDAYTQPITIVISHE